MVEVGASASVRRTVGDDDTARAVGSGDIEVLGTPRLLAWCEAATLAVLDLDETRTSVGTRVQLEHVGASPVGQTLEVTATLVHADGRLLRFEVVAEHLDDGSPGKQVGHGEVTRVVVDRERFLARL